MDRRSFLLSAGSLALVSGDAAAALRPAKRAFGIQLWSVARMLQADFDGTIALLARLGYRELETYGPYSFSDERNQASWRALTSSLGFSGSGLFGRSLPEARRLFRRHAMKVRSLHTDIYTLQTQMGPLADAARALGATYVTLPSLAAPMRTTFDDYKRAADLFNAIGKEATRHGVRFAYHNHGYGLVPVNGQAPLDTLLAATDPAHVFFELDTFWTLAGGADPKDYLTRYRGRYKMVHLKDMKGQHRFTGDGGDSTEWISLFPHLTYLGGGSADMKGIIETAQMTGVDHYFVEQDRAEDLLAAITASANFMKAIGFR